MEQNRQWYLGLPVSIRRHVIEDASRKWLSLRMYCEKHGLDMLDDSIVDDWLFRDISQLINEIRFDNMSRALRSRI